MEEEEEEEVRWMQEYDQYIQIEREDEGSVEISVMRVTVSVGIGKRQVGKKRRGRR